MMHTLNLYSCCCLVSKSCPTLCSSMDCSMPGSSVHGIFQVRILSFPSPGDLPDPEIKTLSPALAGRFFTTEPPGKPPKCIQYYQLYFNKNGGNFLINKTEQL